MLKFGDPASASCGSGGGAPGTGWALRGLVSGWPGRQRRAGGTRPRPRARPTRPEPAELGGHRLRGRSPQRRARHLPVAGGPLLGRAGDAQTRAPCCLGGAGDSRKTSLLPSGRKPRSSSSEAP